MSHVSESTAQSLMNAAAAAAAQCYAPYSHFPVGAAVLTADGEVITGANVENASYGITICAERAALSTAVAAGHRHIVAIAVHSNSGGAPCGACRQFIIEFGAEVAVVFRHNDNIVQRTIGELLPFAFTPESLK